MGRPISGKHALEAVVFACIFQYPFSENTIDSLMSLQETFKETYPVFTTTSMLNMRLDNKNAPPQATQTIAGVSLQKLQQAKTKPAWSLKAEANNIVVSCFAYDRWQTESKKALEDLTSVIDLVADDQNPILIMSLQTVDRFVGKGQDKYQLNQVFKSTSKYLTRQARESGPLWHIYQGWFEKVGGQGDRVLQNLNLSTNETPHGIVSTIDHNIMYHFASPLAAIDGTDINKVTGIFTLLHEKNKEIVCDLLNKKQLKAIGLCQ